jgi:3-hydroxyisobutyrate dehydrogenase-like beta-hydroxyacid dehydrogenase
MMAERIGLIGVGAMGGPMGQNLLKAGHALVVYSRTRTRPEVAQLIQAGASYAASPAEVGSAASVVVTMVGNADDASEVTRGLLSTMARGGMIIGMETIDPATRRAIETEAGAKGIAYLDAPVSGGTIGAQKGALTIMVGSTPEAFERARPLLNVLGTNIYHCGPIGAGAVAKLSNNWIYLASMSPLCSQRAWRSVPSWMRPARMRSGSNPPATASRYARECLSIMWCRIIRWTRHIVPVIPSNMP